MGAAKQGYSVALSASGNTALVGGPGDNGGAGAAWAFMEPGPSGYDFGPKLVGTGAVGLAGQGSSVVLSADGYTELVGGNMDGDGTGASWVFRRSGTTWRLQGTKLVGTGFIHRPSWRSSVALSADGNTALVGGPVDSATWRQQERKLIRSPTWKQPGPKLIGAGEDGAKQGWSVALSADASTALAGGYDDDDSGAVWVFVNPAVRATSTSTAMTLNGADWQATAQHLSGGIGDHFTFAYPAAGSRSLDRSLLSGSIWGSGTCTNESAVCVAAVHAGKLLSVDRGGIVTIALAAGLSAYPASTQHGVTNDSYGQLDSSFVIPDVVQGGGISGVALAGGRLREPPWSLLRLSLSDAR